jgi:hypothetical protein
MYAREQAKKKEVNRRLRHKQLTEELRYLLFDEREAEYVTPSEVVEQAVKFFKTNGAREKVCCTHTVATMADSKNNNFRRCRKPFTAKY